jgi:membrane-bound lytic murein transglycosylase B
VRRAIYFLSLFWASAAESPERDRALTVFLDEMVARHGFAREELDQAFGSTRSVPQILELMDRAVDPKPWDEYRSLFVTAEKISGGERFWSENADALALARERYGVPEEIVIAVIGIETHYGRNRGRFKVLEALATLAFEYPRRASEFRLQLEHFLLLTREESLPLGSPLGSYAGAMGIAQFMPGSYRRYAIDFDGDGRRDLFENNRDAIGSIANYLTAHGWQRNAPVAVPASVSESATEPFRSGKLSTRYRLSELESLGITMVSAPPDEQEATSAIPLTLKNRSGSEYWLGFENFYVITRYNQSVYYAMAVHQLSAEIRGRYELSRSAVDP